MLYEGKVSEQHILDVRKLQKQIAALQSEINEIKQVEASLVKSERRIRSFIELSSDGIVLIDEEGRIVDWNRGEERMTGLKRDEVTGKYIWDVQFNILTEEQKKLLPYDYIKTLIQNILMTGEILGRHKFYEQTLARRDGSTCIMQVMLFPIKTANGFMIGCITRDITDHKRMEESLRQSEERYRLLAENAEDFIYIIDRDLTVKYLNTAGMISINRSLEDIIGKPLSELFPHDTFENMKNNLLKVFEIGKPVSDEHLHRFYNKNFWLNVKLSPIFDQNGKVVCVMGISRDITERKMVEEALKEAKMQAELYLDLMGHDINNIHQAALGYLELARDMPGDARYEYLDKVTETLQRSTQLINNVRKLQKFKDKRVQAYDVDVCMMLAEVHKEYSTTPGKTVTLNLNDCMHCHVQADDLLHDVFANLVGNAVKHTGDRADIVVELDVVEDDGGRYCRVAVEDDGPGIPDDFKATIFNRALKGTAKAKGMGLGLYLVKSLVDSYGGRAWVEDRVPGDHTKGARFVVMLPAIEK